MVTKQQWIDALRSDKYKQGQGRLRRGDEFCCLGVLCDLHAKEDGGSWDSHWRFETCTAYPPHFVERSMGLGHSLMARLADMNDSGDSFKEIANYIEVNI